MSAPFTPFRARARIDPVMPINRRDLQVRRIFVLLTLALVLAGVILVNRWLTGWQFVVPERPGVLYAAAFDDQAEFNDEWRLYPGRLSAGIEDDQLVIEVGDFNAGAFSFAQPHFADFDLRVVTRAVGGPVDNGYGVIFRLQNRDNDSPSDDSYYMFLISSDGYYRVVRRVASRERIISDWIPSSAISQGIDAVNHLRVVGQGSRFQFFVNDTLLELCIPNDPEGISTYMMDTCIQGTMYDALEDDSIPAGQLGVVAISTETGGSGVRVAFDDFIVYGQAGEDGS